MSASASAQSPAVGEALARLRAHAAAAVAAHMGDKPVRACSLAAPDRELLEAVTLASRAALATAAGALAARVSPVEAYLQVMQGPNRLDVIAVWRWPGVLCVLHRGTGELIAQAVAGKPYELEESATFARWAGVPSLAACHFTPAERRAALVAGANRMREKAPVRTAAVVAHMQWGRVPALASWRWPGVVSLIDRNTAEPLAESVPGEPHTLNPAF